MVKVVATWYSTIRSRTDGRSTMKRQGLMVRSDSTFFPSFEIIFAFQEATCQKFLIDFLP